KGEPALQPDVTQAHLFVQEIVVEVLTPALLLAQADESGARVFAYAVGAARLDAIEDGDASAAEAAPACDFQSRCLFVTVGAVEVVHLVAVCLGQRLGTTYQRLRKFLGMVRKIFDPQVPLVEVGDLDALGVVEQPTAAAKAQAIKARKNRKDQR